MSRAGYQTVDDFTADVYPATYTLFEAGPDGKPCSKFMFHFIDTSLSGVNHRILLWVNDLHVGDTLDVNAAFEVTLAAGPYILDVGTNRITKVTAALIANSSDPSGTVAWRWGVIGENTQ